MMIRQFLAITMLLSLMSGMVCAKDNKIDKKEAKPAPKPSDFCLVTKSPIRHHLVLMFLTTTASSPAWTLQSVSATDYASCEACFAGAKTIVGMIAKTKTIAVSGACVPTDAPKTDNKLVTYDIEMEGGPQEPKVSKPIDFQRLFNSH